MSTEVWMGFKGFDFLDFVWISIINVSYCMNKLKSKGKIKGTKKLMYVQKNTL